MNLLSKILFIVVAHLSVIAPISALAAAISAHSEGKEVVRTTTSIFLPTTASGDICVSAQADNVVGGPANLTSNTGAAGAPCNNVFFIKSARQPSIFFTYFDRVSYPGAGLFGQAKFPAPVLRDASISVLGPGQGTDFTLATSRGSFLSSQSGGPFGILGRTASLQSNAEVSSTGATAPGGVATSETSDPWFFTPESLMELRLDVSLTDVNLFASNIPGRANAAMLQAFGAFGLGDQPGSNVLASWGTFFFLGVIDGQSLGPSSITLFNNDDDPFVLSPGVTYWMTARIESGALEVPVPEPRTFVLLGIGILALIVYGCRPIP